MNDSAAWTEEIARYLLICTVFVAIVRRRAPDRHIHVDFLYRLLPAQVCRALSTLVDVVRIVFFAWRRVPHLADDAEDGQLPDDDRRSCR